MWLSPMVISPVRWRICCASFWLWAEPFRKALQYSAISPTCMWHIRCASIWTCGQPLLAHEVSRACLRCAGDKIWTLLICLDEFQLVTLTEQLPGFQSLTKDLIYCLGYACCLDDALARKRTLVQRLDMQMLPIFAGELNLQICIGTLLRRPL